MRTRRKKERLFRKAAFPQAKSFDGYDFSQVGFPEGYGVEDMKSLKFVERAQDFILHGQTECGKTYLTIVVRRPAADAGKSVRFLTTAGLVLLLIKTKREGCLDRCLANIDKSNLVIPDEFWYMPIDPEGASSCSR